MYIHIYENMDYGNIVLFLCRVYSALRQTSLASVCLILDTNGLNFKGSGYHMPESPTLHLKGLSSYPTMITIPKVIWELQKIVIMQCI